ncbi:VIT1/CCC1 transporter family protein [Streptomyces orinoci]|uniref:VIT1/CCC1 transporter family protein n=1 Tax=Streptomyces orinoci TaxID=67339 RepID=A0ABV3K3H4_STRON|nr:VIT1/CCC1 transporter family protein [Streptomyces orinoci]
MPEPSSEQPTPSRLRRWRELLRSEREAAELYERLARSETGERQEVLLELAAVERRHAAHWEERLRAAGAEIPPPGATPLRTRLLGLVADHWSTAAVLPLVERSEKSDAGTYDAEPDAAPEMAEEERGHARTLSRLTEGEARDGITRAEPWHRGDRSGALRAAVFGVSDGLVSNTALVMGIAGSGSSRGAIVLAGTAGLLAGAFSMAAGEYVSMSGQREMYQREISLESQELEEDPESERQELVLLYRAKGLSKQEARRIADTIMADRTVALDTLAREELGLDPNALGSPWSAAGSSMLTFALGALVVILPYLFASGTAAFAAAVSLFVLALAAVGAGIGVLNGRSPLRSAARQVLVGALAAGVTFGVGRLIGTSVS